MVIRPRQQAATPSLCEDTHYLFPQRGPRLERELACHSTASRSAFEGNETAPPLEGVAAELATQTGAYDTNLTVSAKLSDAPALKASRFSLRLGRIA